MYCLIDKCSTQTNFNISETQQDPLSHPTAGVKLLSTPAIAHPWRFASDALAEDVYSRVLEMLPSVEDTSRLMQSATYWLKGMTTIFAPLPNLKRQDRTAWLDSFHMHEMSLDHGLLVALFDAVLFDSTLIQVWSWTTNFHFVWLYWRNMRFPECSPCDHLQTLVHLPWCASYHLLTTLSKKVPARNEY